MHLLGTATIVEVHSFHADPPLTSYTVMVKVSPLAFFYMASSELSRIL